MDVTIPIEDGDLCELLFDHKEKLPDSFYLKLMDMLKERHAGASNENEIYSELVDNIGKVDSDVMKLIMTKFLYILKRQIVIVHSINKKVWPTYTLSLIALIFLVLQQINICIKLT